MKRVAVAIVALALVMAPAIGAKTWPRRCNALLTSGPTMTHATIECVRTVNVDHVYVNGRRLTTVDGSDLRATNANGGVYLTATFYGEDTIVRLHSPSLSSHLTYVSVVSIVGHPRVVVRLEAH